MHDLSPEDARILDQLASAGFDRAYVASLAEQDQARADRLLHLLSLLEDYPVEPADDTLIHATLLRVDRAESHRRGRMTVEPRVQASTLRSIAQFPIRNFVSIAAVLLIGLSIALPILSSLEKQAQTALEQNNLRYVALAVDRYAGDYDGAIPVARAGFDSSLLNAAASAINLTPLMEQRYCTIAEPDADPTATQSPGTPVWLPRLVLFLGPENPVMDALRTGRLDRPLVIDLGHQAQGRNILSDEGAILWLYKRPVPAPSEVWQPANPLWLRDEIRPDKP